MLTYSMQENHCKLPQGRKVFVLLVFINQNSDSTAQIGGCCWAVIKTDNQLDTETLCPGEAKTFSHHPCFSTYGSTSVGTI